MPVTKDGYRDYLQSRSMSTNSIDSYCTGINHLAQHSAQELWTITDLEQLDGLLADYGQQGKHAEEGDYSNGTARNALRHWRDYVAQESTTAEKRPSTYLLTWNPEHYRAGGNAGVHVGETQRWSCNSTKPQPGDHVYLIRLGVNPRGLVARGTVTEGSFKDEDWRDPTKTRSYIRFKTEETRPDCASGLLPMVLLEQLSQGEFKWSAQSSGVCIPQTLADSIDRLWEDGRGIHSLAQCAQWYNQRPESIDDWKPYYRSRIETISTIRNGKQALDESTLEWLWREKNNGVCSIGSGQLYNEEYKNNVDFFKAVTKDVMKNPSKEIYDKILIDWSGRQNKGLFSRRLEAVVRRVFSAMAPERYTTIMNVDDCRKLLNHLASDFELPYQQSRDWFELNHSIKDAMKKAGLPSDTHVDNNILAWMLYTTFADQKTDITLSENATVSTHFNADIPTMTTASPLNQILYGPPGTGKTYNSINKAVEILDPECWRSNQDDSNQARATLKARFDELVNMGQIHFVTFHQSFSYEDFVEGIRAVTDNTTEQLRYTVIDGIFKSCCMRDEKKLQIRRPEIQNASMDIDKINIIHFRFGAEGEYNDEIKSAIDSGQLKLDNEIAATGDLIVLADGNTYLVAIGRVTHLDNTSQTMSISWLKTYQVPLQLKMLVPNPSPVHQVYKLKDERINKDYLKTLLSEEQEETSDGIKNSKRVLIIDEINRGNISRIFGELITLIEPSKRQGADEALEVILPYSKKRFSVPDNLYLIGTMNTADRSLAGLDIALRRRFTFVEMPPKPELLKDTDIDGLNIGQLLEVMNQRIEVLLDRDHCLGHAYFLPLKQEQTLDKLASIFRNQILPLLQEYFFEDWQRIEWVLNGHRAKDKSLCFIKQPDGDNQLNQLFGESLLKHLQDRRWQINEAAFGNIESYHQILQGE
ncbi:AAA family ATPase [Pseudaeromonas sp. ZJS20]|uniref:McrB family protein n=1 Tax=Pseudaeromonas aegiceratis TaxID=3153928 RepID=UPI00390CD3F3